GPCHPHPRRPATTTHTYPALKSTLYICLRFAHTAGMQYTFPFSPFWFYARCRARAKRSRPGSPHPQATAASPAGQHGFAMVEFLVVALPLLFAATASYEASRWYMAREAVNLALLEAGRAGSVSHARPQAIENAFLRSEEHTSELQSRENLVCRLLLEKKKGG